MRIALVGIVLLFACQAFGQNNGKLDAIVKVYMIGYTGPAGGIVFYDKGQYSDGWRYLECAPIDQSPRCHWPAKSIKTLPPTSMDIGSGKGNTDLIYAEGAEPNQVFASCLNIDIGGFRDWFVPSKDELGLIFRLIKSQGKGDFTTYGYFWTSSRESDGTFWIQDFNTGYQFCVSPDSEMKVRAIRRF